MLLVDAGRSVTFSRTRCESESELHRRHDVLPTMWRLACITRNSKMKLSIPILAICALLSLQDIVRGQQLQEPPVAQVVNLTASDGVILKASYFAAANPGPGVLLLHQSNRDRKSWDELAARLALAGINTLLSTCEGSVRVAAHQATN